MAEKKQCLKKAAAKVKAKDVKQNTKVKKSDNFFVQIFNSIFFGHSQY